MTINSKLLDDVDRQILSELQRNARLSFAEIGRRVGLSSPAVAERARRLEEKGVITGYRLEVDEQKLGWPMTAFIRLNAGREKYQAIITLANRLVEVTECHHISGAESFLIKVVASSVSHLEEIIAQFGTYGQTGTSLILSSPVIKPSVALPSNRAETG